MKLEPSTVRFGPFELNRSTGELWKSGVRIRLEGQPLQILSMLVAANGDLVSREALRQALWPTLSFGDFERNLNSAVKRLRAALDDSGHAPEYVERLPRRGYRLLVTVASATPDAERAPSTPAEPPPIEIVPVEDTAVKRARPRWRLAIIGVLVAVLAGTGAWSYHRWSAERLRRSIRSIAVLPFEAASAGPGDDTAYIAFGLTEALTTALSKLGGLRVASATSAQWTRQSSRSTSEIGRVLDVGAVLAGSVVQEDSRVRINVRLVDTSGDTHLWAEAYAREASGLLNLQAEIAHAVAREVRLTLAPVAAPDRIALTPLVDPVAERAYLEGRYHATRATPQDWDLARQAFERALQRRPRHAAALDGLASLYLSADSLPPDEALTRARDAAMRALAINDRMSGSHVTLGIIALYDWDWTGAARALERALALNPADARAIRARAQLRGALGQTTDALDEIRRAVQMDPVSIVSLEAQAHEELQARQFDRASATADRIIGLDPRDARGHTQRAASAALRGEYTDCFDAVRAAAGVSGRTGPLIAIEAFCLGKSGRRAAADRAVAEIEALAARTPVSAYVRAVAAIGAGRLDRAVSALEDGYARRDRQMVQIRMSPWLDEVRGMPAVQQILARMQFPG